MVRILARMACARHHPGMGKKKRPKKIDTSGTTSSTKDSGFRPFAGLLGKIPASDVAAPVKPEAPSPSPAAADFATIRRVILRREKKGRAGKTVTRLEGVPAELQADLLKRLKKTLGCGGILEEGDIVLLGSLVDRGVSTLSEMGIPAKAGN